METREAALEELPKVFDMIASENPASL